MKKFLAYTTIFVLLGVIFFSLNNMFVEEEKEVVVEKEIEQTTLVNVYLVELNKQNNQAVIPVKRKILKDNIYTNTINALLKGADENETKKGLYTEIPSKTILLNIGEYEDLIIVNLSEDFEKGEGSESMSIRLEQVAHTVSDMTEKPVYLYVNGKEISTLGSDGLMVKQPINVTK